MERDGGWIIRVIESVWKREVDEMWWVSNGGMDGWKKVVSCWRWRWWK